MTSAIIDPKHDTDVVKCIPSCILGFAAPIEGGKTTVSKALSDRLKAPRVSFGGYLRTVAKQRNLSVTREALQALGEEMVRQDVRGFCQAVLSEQPLRAGVPLLVDGVRHEQVLDVLRELLFPAPEYLIYVNVDRSTQASRLSFDDLPHHSPLEELEKHSTEVQVRAVLPDKAALFLDGTRKVEELVDQVIAFLALEQRDGSGGWEARNSRRIELAKKKNRQGLSPAELAEFDQLQTGYFEYLSAKHPMTPPDMDQLDRLEERLKPGKTSSE